jgi:carbohydrate kinase (thermoresistant glucokinase family)
MPAVNAYLAAFHAAQALIRASIQRATDRSQGSRSASSSGRLAAREPGIITCSNLKRAYRQITIGSRQGVRLVFLKDDEHVIHARIAQRQHHYMPPTLLRSQFETLEEPGEYEHPVVVTVRGSIAETVTEILQRLAN